MVRPYTIAMIAVLAVSTFPGIFPNLTEAIHTQAQTDAGMLILNEVSPWPADGEVWVELLNPTDQPVALEGWTIEFLSGFSYTFGADSGEVAGGGVHLINITGENPLSPDGDGFILSDPDGPVDAIMWGEPPIDAQMPLSAGPPLMPFLGIISDEEEIHQLDDVCIRIPGTWPPQIDEWIGSHFWVYRGGRSASPGELNPQPPPLRFSPEDGAHLASDFTLYITGFEWTRETTFQIASDPEFRDVVLEETVEGYSLPIDDIAPGMYYWRVRGYSDEPGPWSEYREFTREPFDIEELIEEFEAGEQTGDVSSSSGELIADHKGGGRPWVITQHQIPCPHIQQTKDTDMLCLDGCSMDGNCNWCSAQQWVTDCDHGDDYCVRACIAMAAAAGGCSLSQDRITYYLFEEAGAAAECARLSGQINNPRKDLGHNEGTYDDDISLGLSWIYGRPKSDSTDMDYHANIFDDQDRSDMDTIREYILDNRVIIRHSDDHATVITGCALALDDNGNEIPCIKIQDPDENRAFRWLLFNQPPSEYIHFTFPPTAGRPMRNDEIEMYLDADHDGILDFDETRRFHTDPNNPDSDLDGVHDRQDIQGYVFRSNGNWHWRNPDIDGDGAWKELDPDNDWPNDNGVMDGCEDPNLNGFFDQGWDETDCFVAGDDFAKFHPECQRGWIRNEYLYDVTALYGPVTTGIFNWWETITIEDEPLDSDEYVHRHEWGYELGLYQEGGYTEVSDGGGGLAMARLEADPVTGEYFIHTDTRPSETPLEFTTASPPLGFMIQTMVPQFFYFAIATPHPLGTPERNEQGALVLKGEWLPFEGTGALPYCTQTITWEMWLEPPGS